MLANNLTDQSQKNLFEFVHLAFDFEFSKHFQFQFQMSLLTLFNHFRSSEPSFLVSSVASEWVFSESHQVFDKFHRVAPKHMFVFFKLLLRIFLIFYFEFQKF
jgi:hypothetical protein